MIPLYAVAGWLVSAALALAGAFESPGGYVGAQTCATCHGSIAKLQAESRHGRTWRAPDPDASYTVELAGEEPLRVPVKAVLGGDRFGTSFILELERLRGLPLARRTLIEARYMRSARTGERTLSPGLPAETPASYATAAGRVLGPGFAEKCLSCHGAPSALFRDTGVRCERCHGPGEAHVAAVGRGARELAIVHPGKLPAGQRLEVCAPCHGGFFPLADPRPDELLISNQVTALRNSACYTRSQAALSCLTCHNPHVNARHDDPAYERACLSCHSSTARKQKPCAAGNTKGCVGCHMPVVRRADSFPLVDHWIRVQSRPLPESIRAKVLRGVALAERGEKAEAVRFFEALLPAGDAEPSLHYNLGLAYEEAGRSRDALRAYRKALEVEPDLVAAYINAGLLVLAQGRTDEAIAWLERAVQVQPLEPAAHYNLAIAYQKKGDLASAERELATVVAIDPRTKQRLKAR